MKRLHKSRYWFTGTFTNSVVDPDEMPLKAAMFVKINTETHQCIYILTGDPLKYKIDFSILIPSVCVG